MPDRIPTTIGSWLIVPLAIGIAGCSLLGGSGTHWGPSAALRRFYLTKSTAPGNRALSACGSGYHMASRFEILDVTVLEYDSAVGLATDDSGSGPPSRPSGHEPIGAAGWVRTGRPSRFTDAGALPGSASTNCGTWSSSSHDAYGTIAYLSDRFDVGGAWSGEAQPCDAEYHVWCVENFRGGSSAAADSGWHRGRRPEGPELRQ